METTVEFVLEWLKYSHHNIMPWAGWYITIGLAAFVVAVLCKMVKFRDFRIWNFVDYVDDVNGIGFVVFWLPKGILLVVGAIIYLFIQLFARVWYWIPGITRGIG